MNNIGFLMVTNPELTPVCILQGTVIKFARIDDCLSVIPPGEIFLALS